MLYYALMFLVVGVIAGALNMAAVEVPARGRHLSPLFPQF